VSLTEFQNSSSDKDCNKFAVKCSLRIPPHLKCYATLPCKILLSVLEYQLQGSVATRLTYGEI